MSKDVPIVFPDFPRFVEDGEYLFEQLRPVIASKVTHETAIKAHRKTARPDLVRAGNELRASSSTAADTVARFPSSETVERAALLRELRRAQMAEQVSARRADDARQQASDAIRQASDALAALDHSRRQQRQAEAHVVALQAEQLQWQAKVEELESRLGACSEMLGEVLTSTSWKMTAPFRNAVYGLRRTRVAGSQ